MAKKLYSLRGGLKRARKHKGFNQAKLAETMGVSIKTVMNWEQGVVSPDLEAMMKLSDLLECDLDYLTGRLDEETHDLDFICKETGLSADAIKQLNKQKTMVSDSPLSEIIASKNMKRLLRTLILAADEDEIAWLNLDSIPRDLLSSYADKPINFSTGIGSEVADFLVSQELTSIVKEIREKRGKERNNKAKLSAGINVYRAKREREQMLGQLEDDYLDIERKLGDPEFSDGVDALKERMDLISDLTDKIRNASFAEWKRGSITADYEILYGKE